AMNVISASEDSSVVSLVEASTGTNAGTVVMPMSHPDDLVEDEVRRHPAVGSRNTGGIHLVRVVGADPAGGERVAVVAGPAPGGSTHGAVDIRVDPQPGAAGPARRRARRTVVDVTTLTGGRTGVRVVGRH